MNEIESCVKCGRERKIEEMYCTSIKDALYSYYSYKFYKISAPHIFSDATIICKDCLREIKKSLELKIRNIEIKKDEILLQQQKLEHLECELLKDEALDLFNHCVY